MSDDSKFEGPGGPGEDQGGSEERHTMLRCSFCGRGPEQVDEFLREVVGPIRRKYRKLLGAEVVLKV